MADTLPVVRAPNNRLTGAQFRKIQLMLASPLLSSIYKPTILRWLMTQVAITANSAIETALKAAHTARSTIY